MLAEQLLTLHVGLALPFLLAATLKIAQGSSLVAAITAAGMMQTVLPTSGLDGETGRALAVLAIGAGAMTGPHVNDPFFWLLADAATLRPTRALAWITGGTIVQGVILVAALIVIKEAVLF
jgi:GntP family gluconate:H+ symporter